MAIKLITLVGALGVSMVSGNDFKHILAKSNVNAFLFLPGSKAEENQIKYTLYNKPNS